MYDNVFQNFQNKAGRLNAWLAAIMAFALPLSTSALSILAILILAVWLVEGGYWRKLRTITANPVAMTVLLYLALNVIGLLWTEDLAEGLDVLKNQWKLMLLPVFLTAVRQEMRRVYAGFFVAGMTVAMAMTFLAWFGILHYADVSTTHLTRATSHVIYNPMLALAIYLLLHEVVWGRLRGLWRWALEGLAALMAFNMFITEGRSGQIVFFVFLALLCLQVFKKSILRAVIVLFFLLPAIFAVGYQLSPVFQGRVDRAWYEIYYFKSNPNTSVGLRLLYWQNSWEIIKENPWIGVGTGDFKPAYAKVNQSRSPRMKPTDNPHNQYVLVLCQLGLLGLTALLAIFVTQIRQALVCPVAGRGRSYAVEARDGWERIRLAFPLFFLTIMFTETYLNISGSGFLFSLFCAVLYARQEPSEL